MRLGGLQHLPNLAKERSLSLRTELVAVGEKNAGDTQWNAEVDRPPWICLHHTVGTTVWSSP